MITLLSIFFAGCAAKVQYPLIRLSTSSHPKFSDDMLYDGLEHSILKSIEYLKKISSDRTFKFADDYYTASHMIRSFEYFLSFIQTRPSKKDLEYFIKSNYLVYQSAGRDSRGEVLFTGYYEPLLEGSLNRDAEFNIPVLTLPDDLIEIDLAPFSEKFKGEKITGRLTNRTVVPYYDRREISQGMILDGKSRQLAWLKDPVDLLFLQIQGSGRIYLDTGDTINVHYHGKNGQPYRSIGKLLIDTDKIPRSEMSMQKIREYLNNHPEEIEDVLNYNPSYVFFKLEEDGPLGCLNVKLTPGRSIALDRRIFTLPSLAFIETKKPLINADGKIHEWTDFSRFVSSQDTGGAIRGPGRVDLFWGNGKYARIAAGHMKHTGKLYFLVLKQDVM
ncbi:MAG: MltA domain-containing protein [Desulfobacterales bacterium]|nr:MltA domain-containing protein [Desulfobacterales bacterium]MDX2508817.1 MltA domain-containing protein [Desulfobacterales bacterium]